MRDGSNNLVGQYRYDGDGLRIKKVVPSTGETTVFVYDASNKLVAEYSTIVASSSAAKISYLTNDHLGSPRITTDAIGQVISRRDFMPFGEEIPRSNYGTDSIRQKFTAYQRDNETNLDFAQARMYGNTNGRFNTPDPTLLSVNAHNPQSWNRYVYVMNNPLLYIDPLGLWELRYDVIYKKNDDGSYKYDKHDRPIVDHIEVTAAKTQGDKDTGARLAEQLGLKGKEANKFAEKVGNGDNIRLSEQSGDVGRVFSSVESGLKDQVEFAIKNPDKVKAGDVHGPNNTDCSETACRVAYPQMPVRQEFSVQQADETITRNNARSIQESDLRIADIVRWANGGNPTHFANFIFRNDNGTPVVFSKSGLQGPYETATTTDPRWARYNYGVITGIKKGDSGYYRP